MILVKNVINDLVGYKDLKIVQCNDYFNFSLESVLLPNFVKLNNKIKKIIDLGCGNAPISMILSTKTDAKIFGVELQKEIYDLAKKSIEINNLIDRIELLNMNIKDLMTVFSTDTIDLIVCNPPYFKINSTSILNKNDVKTIARHEVFIDLKDIIKISKILLKNNFSLCLVHRTERLIETIMLLKENNLEPKRIRLIYPKKDSESNMFLIDAVKNGKPGLKVLPPLVVHNSDGNYTKEVLKMFERN